VEVALPTGRTVALPIALTTTGEDLRQYAASLLRAPVDALTLQCTSSRRFLNASMLQWQAVHPGAKLTAKLRSTRPGS
jgi:hypothetical protein